MNNDIKTVLTREAFEHTINESRFFPAELNFDKTLSPSGREEYVNSHIESNWQGFNIAIALLEAAVLSANAGKVDAERYRLLRGGDIIEADDEFIDDDGVRWMPIAGWEKGMRYSSVLKSGRRRIEWASPTQQAIDAGRQG